MAAADEGKYGVLVAGGGACEDDPAPICPICRDGDDLAPVALTEREDFARERPRVQ
ncbi:B-box zinc finger protein [Streptomonospora litoralis]|uniref:hypothetical protein n=1 Tax=Streptomonospora litoralis TaxID=2498135 RepID=UPI0013F17D98|nr:hypothetical protein [Streptomonospora litoralis]